MIRLMPLDIYTAVPYSVGSLLADIDFHATSNFACLATDKCITCGTIPHKTNNFVPKLIR